jgi:uncharacterized protein (TIRG00374 family)
MVLLWLGVAGLLFLALRQAPLAHIWAILSRLRAWQLAVLLGLNFLILWITAARWMLGLNALGVRLSMNTLLAYRLAGFAISYLTPGPQFGGEPLQVHLLHSKQGVALPVAVSSVFLDRLVDLLANFTFLAVGVMTILLAGLADVRLNAMALLFSGSLLLLPLAHLGSLWRGRRPVTWAAGRLNARWRAQRLADIACEAEAQIARFLREQPLVFFRVIGLAGLAWLLMIVEFWLSLHFLGVPANLAQAVSAQTMARLSFLMPFPAGLGALETSQVLATRLLGWDPAAGVALSVLIRARDLFLAVCGLWLGGAAYRSVRRERQTYEERI